MEDGVEERQRFYKSLNSGTSLSTDYYVLKRAKTTEMDAIVGAEVAAVVVAAIPVNQRTAAPLCFSICT
jgi:ABC-type uncharacterized transport system auxiliary subunit